MVSENHDALVKLGRDMEHVKETLEKGLGRINKSIDEGRVVFRKHGERLVRLEEKTAGNEKHISDHTSGHWRFATILVGVCGILTVAIVEVLKAIG